MKRNGFSLVEAMIAAGIVAIGLTAAASLVGALMAKEEINSISLRAANLQEQAVMLYRLGLSPTRIRERSYRRPARTPPRRRPAPTA